MVGLGFAFGLGCWCLILVVGVLCDLSCLLFDSFGVLAWSFGVGLFVVYWLGCRLRGRVWFVLLMVITWL